MRLLAVLGPSGSGKSSLVLAGLIPRLGTGSIDGSERWKIAVVRPGDNPIESLAIKVVSRCLRGGAEASLGQVRELIDGLVADENGLHRYAHLALGDEPEDVRLLVVVDQFEEVFTLCPRDDPAKSRFERWRESFLANLLDASARPGGRVAVVFTMRSDFLGACAPFPRLNDALGAHMVQVGPMREDELREAIEQPAYLVGCEVEPALTERMLAEVEGQAGALPLLQFALTEVWKKREVRKLTLRAYDALGGIEGALEHRANEVFRSFKPEQREVCKRIFLRLVQPGEGAEDTKRRVSYRELLPDDPTQAAVVREVVQALADRDARLITTDRTGAADGAVEVAHEALIRGWKELRGWIEEAPENLRIHRRLTEAAQQWADAAPEERGDHLFTGARLAVASEWARGHADDLSGIEKAFLAASQKGAEEDLEKERRRSRRFRMVAVVAGILATVAVGTGWWANSAREKAQQNETLAKAQQAKAEANARIAESRRLAVLSDAVRPERLDTGLLLVLEALSRADTLEARDSLQRTFDYRPEIDQFLEIPEGYVTSVAFDTNGRVAVGYRARSGGGGVVLFNAEGKRATEKPLLIEEGRVTGVAFDPEGRFGAAYVARDSAVGGGVVLFNAEGERTPKEPLLVKEGLVTGLAFDRDGRCAAAYNAEGFGFPGGGGVVLFDAKAELAPKKLLVKEGPVKSVAFDRNRRCAAAYDVHGGVGGGVVLFDAEGKPENTKPLVLEKDDVIGVAFDAEGRCAVGYNGIVGGGGVTFFDTSGELVPRKPLLVEEGHVTGLAFDRDGRCAAAYNARGGVGGGVVLFDAAGKPETTDPLLVKEGHVIGVAFCRDGRCAAAYEGGIVLFDASGNRTPRNPLVIEKGRVTGLAFDHNGRCAAAYVAPGFGTAGGVVLFDAVGEQVPKEPLQVEEGPVTGVTFDPDGRCAATYPRGVVLFDTEGKRTPKEPLQVKLGSVIGAAFDRDRHCAAAYGVGGGEGGGVVFFDAVGDPAIRKPLLIKEGDVAGIAFDPEGRCAAAYNSRSDVGRVVLFNAEGELTTPEPLPVDEGRVKGVAFDREGRFAAIYYGGVVLFNAAGDRAPKEPLLVKEGGVVGVAFDRDGRCAAAYNVPGGVGGGVVLFESRGERMRSAPFEVSGATVNGVAFDGAGRLAVGVNFNSGKPANVVFFDVDPASLRQKVERKANRNFTWKEWIRYFPEARYRRTIPYRPWPHDLPEEERKKAEDAERESMKEKGAS
ncbi:MAG: hypothetical protein U0800_03140 [Isosphaeraceae bacterium]